MIANLPINLITELFTLLIWLVQCIILFACGIAVATRLDHSLIIRKFDWRSEIRQNKPVKRPHQRH